MKLDQFKNVRNLLFSFGLAMCLQSATAWAQAITAPPAVLAAANRFVEGNPDLKGYAVGVSAPFYAPGSTRIVFWEAKMSDPRSGTPQGFLILNLEGKVVQYSGAGPSNYEMLARTVRSPFKMVRFGVRYVVAENDRGEVLAEMGEIPFMLIDQSKNAPLALPGVIRTDFQRNIDTATPPEVRLQRTYTSKLEAYVDYSKNYDAFFLTPRSTTPSKMRMRTDGSSDNDNPSTGIGGGSDGSLTWVAFGHDQYTRTSQLRPTDPLNTKDYWSGCGGAAFFNTFMWHQQNWTPTLLPGVLPSVAPPHTFVAPYLNDIRDQLGTYNKPFTDEGATLVWDMENGYQYAYTNLAHYVDYDSVWGAWAISDTGDLLGNMIKNFGKPGILGYFSDSHYDVAWAYRNQQGDRYYRIDFPSAAEKKCYDLIDPNSDGLTKAQVAACGSPENWVNDGDIYYASAPYDFRFIDNYMGPNHGFEAGWSDWYRLESAGGHVGVKLRKTDAFQGLAYAHITGPQGSQQRMWKIIQVPSAGISEFHLTLHDRNGANAGGQILIHETAPLDHLGLAPTGKVIAQLTVGNGWNDIWKSVKKDFAPTFAGNELTIEFVYDPVGSQSYMDIDDVKVSGSGIGTGPKDPPPGPCIKGKANLDGGCLD